jgi:hypoxanthine phosphoribosyltransferase
MRYEIGTVVISKEQIQSKVAQLARLFDEFYKDELPVLMPVLTGSFMFAADFVRCLESNPTIRFIKCSSYGSGTVSSGQVIIEGLKDIDVSGKRVLVMEDIIDTGHTFSALADELKKHNPKELKTMALFDKPSRRKVSFITDFVGFTVPDEFLVGYGLDYNEKYRGLPQVYNLREVE